MVPGTFDIDLRWAIQAPLEGFEKLRQRLSLRSVLASAAGRLRLEGLPHLDPERACVVAVTHHDFWEAVVVPSVLIALRHGRPVRFLMDWMFLQVPLLGRFLAQAQPIPVFRKPARWRWWEARREHGLCAPDAYEIALKTLRQGHWVGIYPEGRRNPDRERLLPLRSGAAFLALEGEVPLVPIGLRYPEGRGAKRTIEARIDPPLGIAAEVALWKSVPGSFRDRLRSQEGRQALDAVQRKLGEALARVSGKRFEVSERGICRRRFRRSGRGGIPQATSKRVRVQAVARDRALSASRELAALLEQVYVREKGWMTPEQMAAELQGLGQDAPQLWLLARLGEEPAGMLRLDLDPLLEMPADFGLQLEDGLDLVRLGEGVRMAEVGRFAVPEQHRRTGVVALALMRAAVSELASRGVTHLLTTVFEGDPHSPLHFHTEVLGFRRIGTHARGELRTDHRRILLLLDLQEAQQRLRSRGARILERLGASTLQFERAALSEKPPSLPGTF